MGISRVMRTTSLTKPIIVAVVAGSLAACQTGTGATTTLRQEPSTSPPTTSLRSVPTTTQGDAPFADLDQMLDLWAADNDPVGVVAAALYPDGSLWLSTAGLADREAGTSIDPSGSFEIASITKTFMAALTLRLAEEGIIGLDEEVIEYLPEYPQFEDMTIRMLLGHRAGVYDPSADLVTDLNGPPDPERVFAPDELVAAAAAKSPVFAPGTIHEYSNANYWVLAATLEATTGEAVGSLLDRYVIGPMGLGDTFLFDPSIANVEVVNAYKDLDLNGTEDPMGTRPLPGFITPAWTAGAMISTASDLVLFLDGLFAGRIVDEDSLVEMTDTSNGGGSYGLGMYAVRGYWGHDGGIAGFLSAAFHDPRTGVTVAVLTNRFGPDAPQADALAFRLLPEANAVLG